NLKRRIGVTPSQRGFKSLERSGDVGGHIPIGTAVRQAIIREDRHPGRSAHEAVPGNLGGEDLRALCGSEAHTIRTAFYPRINGHSQRYIIETTVVGAHHPGRTMV